MNAYNHIFHFWRRSSLLYCMHIAYTHSIQRHPISYVSSSRLLCLVNKINLSIYNVIVTLLWQAVLLTFWNMTTKHFTFTVSILHSLWIWWLVVGTVCLTIPNHPTNQHVSCFYSIFNKQKTFLLATGVKVRVRVVRSQWVILFKWSCIFNFTHKTLMNWMDLNGICYQNRPLINFYCCNVWRILIECYLIRFFRGILVLVFAFFVSCYGYKYDLTSRKYLCLYWRDVMVDLMLENLNFQGNRSKCVKNYLTSFDFLRYLMADCWIRR